MRTNKSTGSKRRRRRDQNSVEDSENWRKGILRTSSCSSCFKAMPDGISGNVCYSPILRRSRGCSGVAAAAEDIMVVKGDRILFLLLFRSLSSFFRGRCFAQPGSKASLALAASAAAASCALVSPQQPSDRKGNVEAR